MLRISADAGHWRPRMPHVVLVIAAVMLAPRAVRAQSGFAPLAIPPASVGACEATRTVREPRPGATPFIGHRLVIPGARLGEHRQITVFAGAHHSMLYDDLTLSVTGRLSSAATDVLARIDSLGDVSGRRYVGTTVVPDSALTMRHDSAALHRVMEQSKKSASRTPLTAAEKDRVREMAAWLLKRCP